MNGYDSNVLHLQKSLQPYIKVPRLKFPRWISTPDGDLGTEWCSDCGYYKVRNLRRHDRKRAADYILDGGWRTEEEGFRFCCACGVALDVSLTEYGVENTLDCYEECGFSTNEGYDAWEIDEVLDCVAYSYGDDRGSDIRGRVVALAERYLAQAQPVPPLAPEKTGAAV